MEKSGVRPVRIVEIIHPFRPDARVGEALLAPHRGEYLPECVGRAGLHAPDYVFRVNGKLIESGEEDFILVMPGDEILCSLAAGGGIMKTIAVIGIMVAATAFTDGFAATLFGETLAWGGLGLSTSMSALVSSAIALGGNMLVSAFMGPSMGSTNAASVTYDPTGPKTLAQPGTPIPKAYGTFGWGGNIVSSFVDQDGKDEYLNVLVSFGFGTATSVASVFLNQKPIADYPDLSYQFRYGTNDQTPIPGFDKIENVYPQEVELLNASGPTVVTGTGTNTTGLQIAVKFPGGLMRTDSSGDPKECTFVYKVEVSPSGQNQWTTPIFPRTTTDVYTTDANGFRHYPYWVVMPTDRYAGSGIVYSTDTNEGAHTPGEAWTATQGVTVYNPDNSTSGYEATFTGEWQPTTDIELDLQSVTDWWGGWRLVSNMTNQSFYDVVNVYGLASGKWDARVTKWGAGPHNDPIPEGDATLTDPHYTADGWLWDVTETQFTDLAYPNMILLGIRALATSQLSGADITVQATWTHDIGADTVLPSELSAFEHDNPAIVAYDIIMNPLYGMASSTPNLAVDVPAFVRWAEFCDELVPTSTGTTQRRFVFAGVFDQGGSNAWQCLQQVAQMSRAQIISAGLTYSVAIDAPTDITQVFTEANIKKGSYQETFVAFDDRATLVEVTFADENRNYRTDLPVSVMTTSTINGGLQPKITRTNLLGCANRDQAWQWAYFQLLSTETLLKTAQWNAAIESVTCRIGSVVGVQQRMWSLGGRIQPGSTTTELLIDRTDLPAFTAGTGWTVGVVHPVVNLGTATISSIAATGTGTFLVTFTGNVPAGRILRIAAASGAEATVNSVAQAGGVNSNSVIVSGVQGSFGNGQVVTLYDYDRIELAAVSGVAGMTVTVPGFSQAPTPDAPWFYGDTSGAAPYKTFRVTGIKQAGDFDMQISALEYNPSIYTDPTPSYGEIVSFPTVNAAVTGLTLVEKLQNTSNPSKSPTQSLISVGWDNGANTNSVDVWGQVDAGAWNLLATGSSKAGFSFTASTGDVWSIRVIGKDQFGVPSAYNSAPMATITVQGTGAAPANVAGLTGVTSGSTFTLSWTAAANPPASGNAATASYEIRISPSGEDWNTATQVATGVTTNSYSSSGILDGTYLVKALSAQYVESIAATAWSPISANALAGTVAVQSGGTGATSASAARAALAAASLGANTYTAAQTLPSAGLIIPDTTNGKTYQLQVVGGAVQLTETT